MPKSNREITGDQRIGDLRRRVEQDPTSIAFAQLAEELRRAGAAADAVEVCRAGLRLHPDYVSARVTLGRALIALNQLDTAQEELDRVLTSAPENLAAIRAVADISRRRGNLPEALSRYRAALSLAQNDPELQAIVARLTSEMRSEPANAESVSAEARMHPTRLSASGSNANAGPLDAETPVQRASQPTLNGGLQSPPPGPNPDRERDRRTVAALEAFLTKLKAKS